MGPISSENTLSIGAKPLYKEIFTNTRKFFTNGGKAPI